MSSKEIINPKPLHQITPLVESVELTKSCKIQCYLKMDSSQPSGSYKIRGIGNLIQKVSIKIFKKPMFTWIHFFKSQGVKQIVCASGGNAGMASAYAGKQLGIPVTIVLLENAQKLFVDKLKDEGANVKVTLFNYKMLLSSNIMIFHRFMANILIKHIRKL